MLKRRSFLFALFGGPLTSLDVRKDHTKSKYDEVCACPPQLIPWQDEKGRTGILVRNRCLRIVDEVGCVREYENE